MVHRRDFIRQTGIIIGGMLAPLPFSIKNSSMNEEMYDVIIIGGSYSGLSAGMALGRALRKVLIIDAGEPCNRQTPRSHNFITHDGTPPLEIATKAREQVLKYSTVKIRNGRVKNFTPVKNGFSVETESGKGFYSRKIILATGIKDIMPGIPGFAESWGISVLHCPYCHGYEVKGVQTGVLANGDVAFEIAMLISNWTPTLAIYTNGKSMLNIEQERKLQKNNISIIEKDIRELENGKGFLKNIIFTDGSKASLKAMYTRLPFEQQHIPALSAMELSKDGYIKIDPAHRTNIPGVFACGDNVTRMRTVANAVAMGTTTGMMVNKEILEEGF